MPISKNMSWNQRAEWFWHLDTKNSFARYRPRCIQLSLLVGSVYQLRWKCRWWRCCLFLSWQLSCIVQESLFQQCRRLGHYQLEVISVFSLNIMYMPRSLALNYWGKFRSGTSTCWKQNPTFYLQDYHFDFQVPSSQFDAIFNSRIEFLANFIFSASLLLYLQRRSLCNWIGYIILRCHNMPWHASRNGLKEVNIPHLCFYHKWGT